MYIYEIIYIIQRHLFTRQKHSTTPPSTYNRSDINFCNENVLFDILTKNTFLFFLMRHNTIQYARAGHFLFNFKIFQFLAA